MNVVCGGSAVNMRDVRGQTKEAESMFKALGASQSGRLAPEQLYFKLSDFGVPDKEIERLLLMCAARARAFNFGSRG